MRVSQQEAAGGPGVRLSHASPGWRGIRHGRGVDGYQHRETRKRPAITPAAACQLCARDVWPSLAVPVVWADARGWDGFPSDRFPHPSAARPWRLMVGQDARARGCIRYGADRSAVYDDSWAGPQAAVCGRPVPALEELE